MSGKNSYGGLIWTNHALERIGQRGLSQEMAWEAYKSPDLKEKERDDATKYQKKFGKSTVTLITKQTEKKEIIVLSCWINPPLFGTEDYKKNKAFKEYKKASGLKKVLIAIFRQLGL